MKRRDDVPWVDKYRPKKLDDVKHQNELLKFLKNVTKTGDMPHLLFYGSPGTGKCLSGDTKVMMYDRTTKYAKNIKVGDILMGDDGEQRHVLELHTGKSQLYSIYGKFPFYKVNEEHILCIKLTTRYYKEREFYYSIYNSVIQKTKEFPSAIDELDTIYEIPLHRYLKHYYILRALCSGYRFEDSQTYKFNIRPWRYDNYFGFELDGNGRFVLGDLSITHNTSTILALSNELFGPVEIKNRILELNASDDRGINAVRNEITTFTKTTFGKSDPKYPCPNFKILILDEADAMTADAQSALRKLMEDRAKIIRFCIICNYPEKIIEPIISRCMKFRFTPIGHDAMLERIKYVATCERMNLQTDVYEEIIKHSDGDMRKSIMTLQNLKYYYKIDSHVTSNLVFEITNSISREMIENIYNTCMNRTLIEVIRIGQEFISTGYSSYNMSEELNKYVVEMNLKDIQKSQISECISNTLIKLNEGASENIQIVNMLVEIRKILQKI